VPFLQAPGNGGEAQLSPQIMHGSLWPSWTLWLRLLSVDCLSSLCYRYVEVLLTFLLKSGDGLNLLYVQGSAICAWLAEILSWISVQNNTTLGVMCLHDGRWLQKENAMCHTRRLAA